MDQTGLPGLDSALQVIPVQIWVTGSIRTGWTGLDRFSAARLGHTGWDWTTTLDLIVQAVPVHIGLTGPIWTGLDRFVTSWTRCYRTTCTRLVWTGTINSDCSSWPELAWTGSARPDLMNWLDWRVLFFKFVLQT